MMVAGGLSFEQVPGGEALGSAKFKNTQVLDLSRSRALSIQHGERLEGRKVGDKRYVGESPQCASRVVEVVGIIRKGPPHSPQDPDILRCFIALCSRAQSSISALRRTS